MKKILILLLTISGLLNAQTLLDPSIVSAINSTCCGTSASGIIYVDSVSSNSAGDSLIVFKNGTRYAYKYPSGGGAITDKVETQTLSQNGSNFTFVTKDTNNVTTTQSFRIPDFWRSSVAIPVVANTLPDGTNDTIEFIQHRQDIFIGGADGLVRAGQGAGNLASNTVFGKGALGANTTGSANTAVGLNALRVNSTAPNNTALGHNSMFSNTTGTRNTAIGANTLVFNSNASDNTAVGAQVMNNNTTGGTNTAVGASSLLSNTTGSSNTTLGWQSLSFNTTGSRNTAIGIASLLNNQTGSFNVAIGASALVNNTSSYNIGIGSSDASLGAGAGIRTGTENIAIGSNGSAVNSGFAPLSQMTTGAGNHNTCIGSGASYIEGSRNTTLGWNNADIGVANDNVFIGSRVMTGIGANWNGANAQKIATNKNTFVGADINFKSTAKNAIGDANTALGFNATVDVASITNATALGANSVVDASNQMQLGSNALTQVRTFGVFTFQKTYSEASVPNNSLYVDSATGKLFFKDSAGVSNALY
jgi:hypothetical protein